MLEQSVNPIKKIQYMTHQNRLLQKLATEVKTNT